MSGRTVTTRVLTSEDASSISDLRDNNTTPSDRRPPLYSRPSVELSPFMAQPPVRRTMTALPAVPPAPPIGTQWSPMNYAAPSPTQADAARRKVRKLKALKPKAKKDKGSPGPLPPPATPPAAQHWDHSESNEDDLWEVQQTQRSFAPVSMAELNAMTRKEAAPLDFDAEHFKYDGENSASEEVVQEVKKQVIVDEYKQALDAIVLDANFQDTAGKLPAITAARAHEEGAGMDLAVWEETNPEHLAEIVRLREEGNGVKLARDDDAFDAVGKYDDNVDREENEDDMGFGYIEMRKIELAGERLTEAQFMSMKERIKLAKELQVEKAYLKNVDVLKNVTEMTEEELDIELSKLDFEDVYHAELYRDSIIAKERAISDAQNEKVQQYFKSTMGEKEAEAAYEKYLKKRPVGSLTCGEIRRQLAQAEAKKKNITAEFFGYFVTTVTVVMTMIYPNITQQFFTMMSCKSIGEDASGKFVLGDMSEECYSSTHKLFLIAVAVPMFILWVFGIPFFAFFILFRNRHLIYLSGSNISTVMRERKRAFEAQMAFMYRGYLPTRYYWFLFEMSRKAALVAISVFFPGQLHTQLLMASMLIFIFVLAQVAMRPFENRITEYAEFMSLFTSFMIFYLANFLFIDTVSEAAKELVTWIIIILVVLFVAAIIFAFIKLTREEMELGPLRRRLQAAHAKGEDVNKVLREWRIDQRNKAKAAEQARLEALALKRGVTLNAKDDEDEDVDHAKAKRSDKRQELDLQLGKSDQTAYGDQLQVIREMVVTKDDANADIKLGEEELGQGGIGRNYRQTEMLDLRLQGDSDGEDDGQKRDVVAAVLEYSGDESSRNASDNDDFESKSVNSGHISYDASGNAVYSTGVANQAVLNDDIALDRKMSYMHGQRTGGLDDDDDDQVPDLSGVMPHSGGRGLASERYSTVQLEQHNLPVMTSTPVNAATAMQLRQAAMKPQSPSGSVSPQVTQPNVQQSQITRQKRQYKK